MSAPSSAVNVQTSMHAITVIPKPSADEIRRTLQSLFEPADVIELRALHKQRKRTDAGYFDGDHWEDLIAEASRLNTHGAAVYVTMNPIDPQLLARTANRVQEWAKDTATDANVTRRRWLLIDIDPQRPKDTSATDEQLEAARHCARAVYGELTGRGWARPIVAESGNGMHLFFRVDLPNDEESRELVKRGLEALAAKFDNDSIKIDRAVFNAARIVKLHGTIANKGDHVPVAPWRLSRLMNVPDELKPLSREQLEALAAEVTQQKAKPSQPALPGTRAWGTEEMQRFLTRGGIEATGPDPHEGVLRWKLKVCPFNESHGFGESAVFLRPDGRLGFECRHSSCQGKHWQDLRSLVDGERPKRSEIGLGARQPAGDTERGFVGFEGAEPGQKKITWAEPRELTSALPPVEPFVPQLLPEVLRPWVTDVAERTQAPVEYVAVSAVVSMGAALGRKLAIRLRRLDDWHEFANLWGVVIGPPSWMKSPALDEGKRPLERIEASLQEDYVLAHREWEADEAAARVKRDGAKDNARKAARSGKTFDKMALVEASIPDEPKPQRIIVNNATIPAICEVLRANPPGVMVYRDEIAGFIAELDSEGMQGSRSFYLSGWSAKEGYTEDRIGRGTNLRVPYVCISMLGGIQPAKIAPLLRDSVTTGGSDGFLARFSLAVWPDNPGEYRAVDRAPNHAAREAAYAVYRRLYDLEPSRVGAETIDGQAPFLRLAPDAAELFTGWDVELRNAIRRGDHDAALAAHLGKFPKVVAGLALLFHLADGGTGEVTCRPVERALGWADFLTTHANRLYAGLGHSRMEGARTLLTRLKRGDIRGPFKLRDVYVRGWSHLADAEAARSAIAILEAHDCVKGVEVPAGPEGGRPTTDYHVNPSIQVEAP